MNTYVPRRPKKRAGVHSRGSRVGKADDLLEIFIVRLSPPTRVCNIHFQMLSPAWFGIQGLFTGAFVLPCISTCRNNLVGTYRRTERFGRVDVSRNL